MPEAEPPVSRYVPENETGSLAGQRLSLRALKFVGVRISDEVSVVGVRPELVEGEIWGPAFRARLQRFLPRQNQRL